MAASPVFVGTPKTWTAALSVANANRDGSGTLVDVVAGGSSGSRIDSIRIIGSGIVTDGMVRLFIQDTVPNRRLFKEVKVTATTPSATVETFTRDLTFPDGLAIPNGWTLRAATHNAENFNVIARGGDH